MFTLSGGDAGKLMPPLVFSLEQSMYQEFEVGNKTLQANHCYKVPRRTLPFSAVEWGFYDSL